MKTIITAVSTGMLLVYSIVAFAGHSPGQPQRLTIGEFVDESIIILTEQGIQSEEQEIHFPGVSFIKLHFSHFKPPKGLIVEVTNPSGSESYIYSRGYKDAFTFDPELGDDGVNSFSAMSVSGDTLIIKVHKRTGRAKRFNHSSELTNDNRIIVDHVIRGYSTDEVIAIQSEQKFRSSKSESHSNTESSVDGSSHIETNCGSDERYDTVCWAGSDPAAYDRSRPVAKIVIGIKSCTAWRVGSGNRMFTNNHCIGSKSEASKTEVWFNYESSDCGGAETEQVVKVSVDQLLSTDYTLDYSLFSVHDFSTIEPFGNLGLEIREAILGEGIYIPQHGSGDPKQLSIESDIDLDGICQVDDDNFTGRDSGTSVGYYCDTTGGSSGSPVVSVESNKVIGLHNMGGCMNAGVKMSLIWPKVRRHFNRVVPEGDWEGTPAPEPNANPVASFGYSCDQLSCNFNGGGSSDSDGSIVSYSWSFGDSSNGSGVSTNHTFASEGSYNVSLTVQDDAGSTDSTSKTLSVVIVSLPTSPISLAAQSIKQKGAKLVDLEWSGAETSQVEIFRNDLLLVSTANDGAFTDTGLGKREKSATYRVCEQSQLVCSNEITLDF